MKLEYLPNILCFFRILLVPPVLIAISTAHYELAMLLFMVAAVTDGLDGFLARTFNWHSELGALLDPVADKLLMVFTFVWLVLAGLLPAWLAAVVVGRDAVIVIGAISYRVLIGPFQGAATNVSKLNTLLQILLVVAVLAHAAYSLPQALVVSILGSLVFVTAVISGLHYVRGWTMLALSSGKQT